MPPTWALIREADVAREVTHLYGGEGTISLSHFAFGGAPAPARFVVYDMPPGSSEGVHTHRLGEAAPGPFDEYYYVIAGEGVMSLAGEAVPLKAGDHVHAPLGVAHGIANTSTTDHLRLFLTFIAR